MATKSKKPKTQKTDLPASEESPEINLNLSLPPQESATAAQAPQSMVVEVKDLAPLIQTLTYKLDEVRDAIKSANAPVNYGLLESLGVKDVTQSLQDLADKLGNALKTVIEETSSLDVCTYVSDDIASAEYKDGKFSGARLRARTRIAFDGDTIMCLPRDEEGIDESLLKIHADMVERAQANRVEMFKTAVSALAGLVGVTQSQ